MREATAIFLRNFVEVVRAVAVPAAHRGQGSHIVARGEETASSLDPAQHMSFGVDNAAGLGKHGLVELGTVKPNELGTPGFTVRPQDAGYFVERPVAPTELG